MVRAELITRELLRAWPLPDLGRDGDKGVRGDVQVVGGTVSTPGAVILAGLAALRVGAGRLAITTVEQAAVAVAVQVPEAKVDGEPTRDGAMKECRLRHEPDAVVVGPGLTEPGDVVQSVLETCGDAAVVLDAGALRGLPDRLPRSCVLTPNAKELEALANGGTTADTALAAAARLGVVVCTHGWVAAPDGRLWECDTGSIALGTSGSGDVLAGIVGGLLARGAEPAQAACWGQYLHGRAAQELAPQHGRVGLLARELLDVLPALVEELTA
jgi:hydroxyethylthiazole kinase-like uncharacterized protein yjeF